MFSLLAFFGCSNSSMPSTSTTTFFPLQPGEHWVYSITDFDSLGQVLRVRLDTITVLTASSALRPGWMPLVHSNQEFLYDTNWMLMRTDGLWQWPRYDPSPSLLCKYPTTVGDTFGLVENFPIDTSGPFTAAFIKTVSTAKQITTPAGTFTCIEYACLKEQLDRNSSAVTHTDTISTRLLSPGVGDIDFRYYYPAGYPKHVQEWLLIAR
ncbi:MAG: hypothetical protein JSS75_02235 [Bacteroidetes bacterium]|nr:hypothetical protein [Bacteroidota bacterium]